MEKRMKANMGGGIFLFFPTSKAVPTIRMNTKDLSLTSHLRNGISAAFICQCLRNNFNSNLGLKCTTSCFRNGFTTNHVTCGVPQSLQSSAVNNILPSDLWRANHFSDCLTTYCTSDTQTCLFKWHSVNWRINWKCNLLYAVFIPFPRLKTV